jgi:hypothetical protein
MRYLFVLLSLIACQVQAGSANLMMPPEKTIEACQMRLSIDGRIVAHMRWVLEYDQAKAHAQFTPADTVPAWYVGTVRGWIDSAYKAGNTPEEAKAWFQMEWDGCEGPDA